jgi:hypothetical protein
LTDLVTIADVLHEIGGGYARTNLACIYAVAARLPGIQSYEGMRVESVIARAVGPDGAAPFVVTAIFLFSIRSGPITSLLRRVVVSGKWSPRLAA